MLADVKRINLPLATRPVPSVTPALASALHPLHADKPMSWDCLAQEVVHQQLKKAKLIPRPFFIHAYAHKCVALSVVA